MPSTIDEQKARLRQYLNSAIRGENTDIILEALASGSLHLIDSVEAVNDQLYIVTASESYLDERLADRDLTRPENVGLSDDVFRQIGIEVVNRKQVRDLMHNILNIMYGDEFTRATADSGELEPYQLEDGDTLLIEFDDSPDSIEITFQTSQFVNINAATAQEVADAITRQLRSLGESGAAVAKDDGAGGYVQIRSQTDGPASAIRVLGGKAQNKLRFEQIRPTTGIATTQWTLEVTPSGNMRATWTGGANPSIGKISSGDYVNIYGTAFDTDNRGTFTITEVQGGLISDAYVEFDNPNGVSETVLQGNDEAILFFNPVRRTVSSKKNFAAAYQTENRILEVFMPATTRVVRRDRQGAAHIHESGASTVDDLGPYLFDISKAYIIGDAEANTTAQVDASTERIIDVDNASDIPDESGYLIFGLGTQREEGPVPYIGRPSTNTILIDPSYRFENIHPSGTNISLVEQNYAYDVETDGTDYPAYLTDIVSGRIYAEELINLVSATGINVIITILYPEDEGLGKWGDDNNSEKYYVWGDDPESSLF